MVSVHRPDVCAASPGKSSRFEALVARDPGSRYAALALRHRVFAGEMGAKLRSPYPRAWTGTNSIPCATT